MFHARHGTVSTALTRAVLMLAQGSTRDVRHRRLRGGLIGD